MRWSLRVAVITCVLIGVFIFFPVTLVRIIIVFIFFLIWLLSEENIGNYLRGQEGLLSLEVFCARSFFRAKYRFTMGHTANSWVDKSELQLHHCKYVLHLRAHRRLGPVLRPLDFVNTILVAVAPMGGVLDLRCALPDHFALSAIILIAPHSRFFAMQ